VGGLTAGLAGFQDQDAARIRSQREKQAHQRA